MGLERVAHVLLSATTVAAVLGLLALAGLLLIGAQRRRSPYWYPMVLWVAHASAFFCANVTVRVFTDYVYPSVLFSSWGVVIYLQAFISMIAVTIVKFRMDSTGNA